MTGNRGSAKEPGARGARPKTLYVKHADAVTRTSPFGPLKKRKAKPRKPIDVTEFRSQLHGVLGECVEMAAPPFIRCLPRAPRGRWEGCPACRRVFEFGAVMARAGITRAALSARRARARGR